MTDQGPTWADAEAQVEGIVGEYPELEAVFAPLLEFVLTMKDAPDPEGATAFEVKAWQRDLIGAADLVARTFRALPQALAEAGLPLPADAVAAIIEGLKPFDDLATLPPDRWPIQPQAVRPDAYLAGLVAAIEGRQKP